jgi:hypothetical protein
MFIPDPWSEFFHPRSRVKNISDQGSASKIFFQISRKYDPGCSSRIPDQDLDFLPILGITDPGVKKTPEPESVLETLI